MKKFKTIVTLFLIMIVQFYKLTTMEIETEIEYIVPQQQAIIVIKEILIDEKMKLEDRIRTALKVAQGFNIDILTFIENTPFFKKENLTPLIWAAQEQHTDLIPLLLESGAKPNKQNQEGSTALMLAQDPKIIEVLFEYGADPNLKDAIEETALHNAVRENNSDKVKELLKNLKINIESENTLGQTPLHLAAFLASAEIIELLLKAGAEVNAIDKEGSTPLHNAVEKANPENIAMLLAYKANKKISDFQGNTPLDLLDEKSRDFVKINNLLQK